jgi:hypothetical protein
MLKEELQVIWLVNESMVALYHGNMQKIFQAIGKFFHILLMLHHPIKPPEGPCLLESHARHILHH